MSELFASILTSPITLGSFLLCIAASLVCGVIAAFAFSFRTQTTRSYITSLILLPAIVCAVIAMVNGNLGTGLAVAGAFSLVRFRSAPGRAKEIAAIFLVMAAGLTCSTGYIAIAVLFTLIIAAVQIVLTFLPLGDDRTMQLNITVPESLNFEEVFDEPLRKYTRASRLISVKTTNMGSLYKLKYQIKLKDATQQRAFLDDLRCRNGNLEISLFTSAESNEDL